MEEQTLGSRRVGVQGSGKKKRTDKSRCLERDRRFGTFGPLQRGKEVSVLNSGKGKWEGKTKTRRASKGGPYASPVNFFEVIACNV